MVGITILSSTNETNLSPKTGETRNLRVSLASTFNSETLSMKNHFTGGRLAVVLSLFAFVFSTFAFATPSKPIPITNTGGPIKLTTSYGGPTTATVTAPDWIKVEKTDNQFADGWQIITVSATVAPSDEPRAGTVEVSFDVGSSHKFRVEQAGRLVITKSSDTLSTQIPLEAIADAWFIPYEGDREPIPMVPNRMDAPKQRGWLFIKTKSGNRYSSWYFA